MQNLSSLRLEAGRPESLDDMLGDQLQDEKIDMQHQLNVYESLHGLQDRQENREIMAQIYERYFISVKFENT